MHPYKNRSDLFRAPLSEQDTGRCEVFFGCAAGHSGNLAHQLLLVTSANFVCGRRRTPLRIYVGVGKKAFRTSATLGRYKDNAETLLARSPRAPAPVNQ